MVIIKENIRRYLLLKQLLLSPQSLHGQKGIAKVFNTLRSIQFDPQNPCGTNVDLVLQSRGKRAGNIMIYPLRFMGKILSGRKKMTLIQQK